MARSWRCILLILYKVNINFYQHSNFYVSIERKDTIQRSSEFFIPKELELLHSRTVMGSKITGLRVRFRS